MVGGPNDGVGSGGRARRFGIGFIALAILVVIVLLGVGVNFLTDAIWFQSVGFESVFWTRVLTQVGLFAGGGIVALRLPAVQHLAGRPARCRRPIPDGRARSPAGSSGLPARIRATRTSGRPWENGRPARPGGNRMGPRPGEGIALSADDLPDLAPIARWVLIALVVLIALGVAGLGRQPLGDDPAVAQPGALQPGRRRRR